jgi:hypothetical protein
MLVSHIDHAASLLSQTRSPVHVRIAHQRKAGARTLLDKGLGKDIVDVWLGFVGHRCILPGLALILSPLAPAIRHRPGIERV